MRIGRQRNFGILRIADRPNGGINRARRRRRCVDDLMRVGLRIGTSIERQRFERELARTVGLMIVEENLGTRDHRRGNRSAETRRGSALDWRRTFRGRWSFARRRRFDWRWRCRCIRIDRLRIGRRACNDHREARDDRSDATAKASRARGRGTIHGDGVPSRGQVPQQPWRCAHHLAGGYGCVDASAPGRRGAPGSFQAFL